MTEGADVLPFVAPQVGLERRKDQEMIPFLNVLQVHVSLIRHENG